MPRMTDRAPHERLRSMASGSKHKGSTGSLSIESLELLKDVIMYPGRFQENTKEYARRIMVILLTEKIEEKKNGKRKRASAKK